MRKVSIEQAIGKPLLHDVTQISDGFKGARFKKGHVISKDDVPVLLDMGKKLIYVADGDERLVHEEDAARRLAAIAKCEGTRFSAVSEGKIVQIADRDGFFVTDLALLAALNSLPDITICTIRSRSIARKGAAIASMRIIPLYTDEKNLKEAEDLSRDKSLFRLYALKRKKVGIIITGSEVFSRRIEDRFEPVLRRKLQGYEHEIVGVRICDDDASMIMDACRDHMENGADLLLLTGGMSVDADDVTVDAIASSGFDIVTYGVPSQPGNMTLLAYAGDIPAIGVPSAAISRPITVLDALLPSIFADVRITKADIIAMANGGLCMACDKTAEGCHFPNCGFGKF